MKKSSLIACFASIVWIILITVGVYLYLRYTLTLEEIFFGAKSLLYSYPYAGILVFLVAYIVRPLFLVIAIPFDLFSGMVFGPLGGFIISSLGSTLSCIAAYVIGKYTAGVYVPKTEGKRFVKFRNSLQNDPFYTALSIRFLQLPYDVSNYFAGAFKIPGLKYIAGSSLGILPSTFVFVSAGSAFYGEEIMSYKAMIENIQYENLWFASGFFCTMLIVGYLLKRKNRIIIS